MEVNKTMNNVTSSRHLYTKNQAFQQITDAIKSGIELLRKEVDIPTINAWNNYVIAILDLVSLNLGINLTNNYRYLIITNTYTSPTQQLSASIEFLLMVAKQLNTLQ